MAEGMGVPLIGISAYCERARWGAWDQPAIVLPRRYADRVAAAGGIPVLLPPVPGIEDALERLDGLLLSGGGDIDPGRYGAEPAPQLTSVREERDTAEFALLSAAQQRHLPDVVGHDGHAPVLGAFGSHVVRVEPGSRLSRILGRDEDDLSIATPTHHHQGVDKLGSGLTPTAWAQDGTVEAFELDEDGDRPFLVAVQWHPEAGDDPSLFRAFVAAARDRASAPAPA